MLTLPRLYSRLTLTVIWLTIQSGSLVGIALNWESTPANLLLSGLYGLLNLLILGLLWWLGGERLHDWLRRRTLTPGVFGVFGLISVVIWALPLTPTYPFDALRWLFTTLAITCAIFGFRTRISLRGWRIGFWALLIAFLWFSLATVRTYPNIYTDEGWYLNKAWSSADQGPLYAASIHLGVLGEPQRIDAPIEYWPAGLWLRMVGLGIWQGRLSMWLLLPLLVALIYRAGYRLTHNRRVGLLAALLIAASVPLLNVSHLFRPEMVLAVILALALYLYALAETRQRFREPFILGLLLALSMAVHTNAMIFCLAFGGLYLGRTLSRCWRERRLVLDMPLLGLAAGGIIGAIIFALVYILPDPTAFFEQINYSYRLNFDVSKLTLMDTLTARLITLVNRLRAWFAFSLVEASAILLAVIAALIWGRRFQRSLVILLALCFVGFFIVGGRDAPTYVAILAPLAALLIAGILARLWPEPHQLLAGGALLIAATWGVSIQQVAVAQQEGYNAQFTACLTALSDALPVDGMILGEHLFWLARPQLTGYAARTLVEAPWPGRDVAGWWAWIDPDIVLWPGPIYGPNWDYVQAHDYKVAELPQCPPSLLTIWLKPGVQLNQLGS